MKDHYLICLLCIIFFVSCKKNKKPEKEIQKVNYLLTEVDSNISGVNFSNTVNETQQLSIINYIYFYNGGGVAAGDVNKDGLPDLYFVSNTGENKLFLNKGNLKFEDISKSANISGNSSWNTGVTFVDINGDGFLDIYVCAVTELFGFKGHNELFINQGNNTFLEQSKEYGLDFRGYSTQAYFFDYDKDYDLDVYIVNHAVHTALSHGNANLRNDRVANIGDVLLKNNNGKFEDVSEKAGIFGGVNGYGLSAAIADFNNDGWDDIYVCNDFHEDDYYYINKKDGTFSEALAKTFTTTSRFSMGSDAADINGDGFQDLMTLDMLPNIESVLKETEGDDVMLNKQAYLQQLGYKNQYSRNMLQINESGNYFLETALYNEIADTDWSWAPLFADYNNDGYQDLFISNGILRRPNGLDFIKYVSSAFRGRSEAEGSKWLYNSIDEMPSGSVPNEIFEGNSKKFKEQTGTWIDNQPKLSNGALYSDLDLDGDLDLVLNNYNQMASLYENTTNGAKSFVSFKLTYQNLNRHGIGSKISVYSNGLCQTRQLFRSRGFLSSMDSKLHFGLGDHSKIDSVEIIWPNQNVQILYDLEINREVPIIYKEGKSAQQESISKDSGYFKKVDLITYEHKEDSYNDFLEEKLIPYKVSASGPAMATADIDQNGYDDVFLGAASGFKAAIYMNTGTTFVKKEYDIFEQDAAFEDNNATFFDADGDGDYDLYVASGISSQRQDNYQNDRLYINSGADFEQSENSIPNNPLVTSVAINYDYDGDGDEDLFVGNRSKANDYGVNVSSYILNNDGFGKFSVDLNFKLDAKVTDAVWVDIDEDGTKDLIVSAEWDTPKLYINKGGKFELQTLPGKLNGLWQTIDSFDMDGDGDLDIMLGNWGLNTKFNLYFDGSLVMYHSDFDKNGKNETVLAYNRNGKYFPLNSKLELVGQMPYINRKFIDHKSFAGKTIEQVFGQENLNEALKFQVDNLSSGYLRNDNGIYTEFIEFPNAFQMGPINAFSEVEINTIKNSLASGNLKGVNSYHGGYTSLKGLFAINENQFSPVSAFGLDPFDDEVRQVKVIKMNNYSILIVASNNSEIKTYAFKN